MKASSDQAAASTSVNIAIVRGQLSTEVNVSALPAGGTVHNFEVKTGTGRERFVVPVAWHDPTRPPRLRVGDDVVVIGAVRRRWFRAGGGSQSRTEVVARVVGKAGSRRAATAIEAVVAELAGRDGSEGRKGIHQ